MSIEGRGYVSFLLGQALDGRELVMLAQALVVYEKCARGGGAGSTLVDELVVPRPFSLTFSSRFPYTILPCQMLASHPAVFDGIGE